VLLPELTILLFVGLLHVGLEEVRPIGTHVSGSSRVMVWLARSGSWEISTQADRWL
jgi:hypothetical protein